MKVDFIKNFNKKQILQFGTIYENVSDFRCFIVSLLLISKMVFGKDFVLSSQYGEKNAELSNPALQQILAFIETVQRLLLYLL